MIELKKKNNTKRSWKMVVYKGNKKPIELELNLLQFSLPNRFDVVQDLFKDLNKLSPKFSSWMYDTLKSYIDSEYNAELILKEKDKFIQFANEYIDLKEIDFDSFVDPKKSSKSSILFDATDIRSIALASTCLKMSSIFFYDSQLKVPDNIQRSLYNAFISECIENKTTDKIFQLIRARTYKSSITDRFMWNLIKMTVLETPETNVMNVFNFLTTNLISLLDIEVNPVHYLIKVADDSVRWMFCEVYKERIIYGESFGGTDDIFGASVSKESFHIYCCNDVIAKAAKAGLQILKDNYGIDDESFIDLKDRLEQVTYIDPSMRLFTLPIASKVLDIPYRFLLTASPKHIVLIGVLLHHIAEDTLVERYPILSDFLLCYPEKTGFLITKSSYKLRDVDLILKDNTPMFGLNSRKLKFEVISPICGILSASKKNVSSIIDGRKLSKITYADLENDASDFYTKLYGNELTETFEDMKNKLDEHII